VTEGLASDTGSSSTDLITSNDALTGSGDPNATVAFTIDGVAIASTATANASGIWTYTPTGLANGSHKVTATETDSAGNVGAASLTFTLDTVAPAVKLALTTDTGSSSTDRITSKDALTGSGDPNAIVHFTIDGAASSTTATASATGAWSFTPSSLANGSHTISASETDTAGNIGTASLTFTYDTVAPVVKEALTSDTGSSSTDKITSKPGLTGSGDPNAVVHFTVDGTAIAGTATANASGAWSYTPTGLADGSHTIVASETDAAGNTGTATLAFTLDTTPPAVTESLVSDTGSSSTDNITSNPAVQGTGDPSAAVHISVDGVASSTVVTANSSGAWSYTPTGLADGSHTIVASETDVAGNTGAASLTFTLFTAPPALAAVNTTVPMGGAVSAASLVTSTVASGDAITNYEFLDSTTSPSSGFFEINGVTQTSGNILDIGPSSLSSLIFIGGSATGTDEIWARATDGQNYGNWTPVEVTTQGPSTSPATVTAPNTSLATNTSVALASLFTVSDPANLSMTEYQFLDLTPATNSGHLTLAGVAEPAGQVLDFGASLLSNAAFAAGSPGVTDTLAMRAYDGGSWSAWKQFNIASTT
jgi:class 3 adenylate cyclase